MSRRAHRKQFRERSQASFGAGRDDNRPLRFGLVDDFDIESRIELARDLGERRTLRPAQERSGALPKPVDAIADAFSIVGIGELEPHLGFRLRRNRDRRQACAT